MGRTRFYSPATSFDRNHQSVTLEPDEARHLREVLRARVGDEVFVFDGQGREFQCVVTEARRNSAQLEVKAEVAPAKPESPLNLILAVALLKGEKFDLVVQKTTELGVKRLIPISTTRADIKLRDPSDADKRVARWQRIAIEASKQSGRAHVPEVMSVETLSTVLQNSSASNAKVLFFSERDGGSLRDALQGTDASSEVLAIVGAEGGWTDEEIDEAKQAGCEVVTLGGRVLRAETAGIVVATLLQHHSGDLV
jgi:16S rRNA (uracil1498-N3)-methyltransferase